jgi:hypothetical protein
VSVAAGSSGLPPGAALAVPVPSGLVWPVERAAPGALRTGAPAVAAEPRLTTPPPGCAAGGAYARVRGVTETLAEENCSATPALDAKVIETDTGP